MFFANFYSKLHFFKKRVIDQEYHYSFFKKEDLLKNVLTKEQKREIDNFYKKYYGKKIPHLHLWHNLFTQYSGHFDVKYIPADIFKEYLLRLDIKNKAWNILQDKNFLYNIAKVADVNIPKRYFYSINNNFFDSDNNIISEDEFYKQMSNIGEVFIKPTQLRYTGSAKNCKLVNVSDDMDTYSNTNIKDLIKKCYTHDFVVQEKIVCHKSISDIYPKSVNTFGLNTILLNNTVKVLKPGLKIGMNDNIVDYGGIKQKGLLIPIKEDGTLYDYAFCLNEKKKYYTHPDTGVPFKNYKIDLFPKILEAATKLQKALPWLPFCGWDFTIDESGNVLVIEVESPSCTVVQTVYGEGFFGEYTEQILSFLKSKKN